MLALLFIMALEFNYPILIEFGYIFKAQLLIIVHLRVCGTHWNKLYIV